MEVKQRNQIQDNYKWNLCDIYATEDLWEKDLAKMTELNAQIGEYAGKLNDKQNALSLFNLMQDNGPMIDKLYCYARLAYDLDGKSVEAQNRFARISALYSKFGEATAFINPELSMLSVDTLNEMIEDSAFADFDIELMRIRDGKEHILSDKEEKILASIGSVTSGFQEAFGRMDSGDFEFGSVMVDGEEVKLSHGIYGMLLQHPNQEVRRDAFQTFYKPYMQYVNTIASIYGGSVKNDWFVAKTRKFNSTMERALFNERVDKKVYTNLIDSIHANLEPLHEYIGLRKKMLGVETLNMYDLYVPIVNDVDSKIDFEEAFLTVKNGLKPLGEDYQELLQKAKDERWMDVYETPNKRSGAYSMGVNGVHPFVLLNFQGTVHDTSTVAHELGHSMHSYFSSKTQCYEKSSYTIFVAEVASTCNEILLHDYLMKTVTDVELKKNLLGTYLDMLRTTMYRQAMFAEFEYITHNMVENDIPLTYKALCDEYLNLNKTYYGPHVNHNEEIAYEWARIPHFYRAFYVYKYSTGIISAICLAQKILSEGAPAVERYKKFLSLGGSMDPVSELKVAGVDLTQKEPFEIVAKSFKDTLEELKKLI